MNSIKLKIHYYFCFRAHIFAVFYLFIVVQVLFTPPCFALVSSLAASRKESVYDHSHHHHHASNVMNCSASSKKRSLFLWSVDSPSQRNVRSFLFGTIHVSYNEVWDYVSEKVKEVFGEAESIVFELELHNPETIEILLQIFERLKLYMKRFKFRLMQWSYKKFQNKGRHEAKKEARRLYNSIVGGWEVKRPVWLLFLLYQMSESFSQNESSPMLDVFLAQKAQEQGKKLHSIETPAEQCNPLFSISQEQIVFAINYTLSYLEWIEEREADEFRAENFTDSTKNDTKAGRSSLGDLIQHYRCGSLEASVFNTKRFVQNGFTISPEMDHKARQIDNLLVEDIILKRNVRMASRANDLLKQSPTTAFFFALGAGHFLGENSLISALEEYGYHIAPVKEDDDVISYIRNQNLRFAKEKSRFNELWMDHPELVHIPNRSSSVLDNSISHIPELHSLSNSSLILSSSRSQPSVLTTQLKTASSLPILYIPVTLAPGGTSQQEFRLIKSGSANGWAQTRKKSSPTIGPRKLPLLAPRPAGDGISSLKNESTVYLSTMDKKREACPKGILLSEGNGQLKIPLQQREQLKRRIAERPSRQKLVTQHILLCPSSVDPLIQARCQDLKKNKLVDNLNRKLQRRPGPLELVTKKILQVDAELEEALQEGLLPFKSTISKSSPHSFQPNIINNSRLFMPTDPNPVESSDLMKTEHAPPARIPPSMVSESSLNDSETYLLGTKISNERLAEVISSSSGSSSPVSVIAINNENNDSMQDKKENNYKNLLKQQEILLEWQDDIVEEEEEDEIRDEDSEGDLEEKETEYTQQMEDTYGNSINAMVETPPCLLSSEQQEAENMQTDKAAHVHHEEHKHSNVDLKLQKCCQCTVESAVQNAGDNAPSSTTTEPISGIRSRLMEFKVQDLKKECRKRQLAASGTKNVTVSSCPSAKTPRAHSSAGQKNAKGLKKSGLSSAATNASSTIDMSVIDAVASNIKAKSGCKGDAMKMGPPIRDVIHDYLQQKQQHPALMLQMPNGRQQQIVQLVDADGAPLSGNSKAVCLPTLPNKGVVYNSSSKPFNTTCCNCSHEETQRFSGPITNTEQRQQFNQSHQRPEANKVSLGTTDNYQHYANSQHQKFPESTFSFAQMGSGGQFTLAESSSQHSANNNGHMTAPVNSVASSLSPLKYPRKAPSACTSINPNTFACNQQSTLADATFSAPNQFYGQNKASMPYPQQNFNTACNCNRDARNSQVYQGNQNPQYYSGSQSHLQNEASSRRRHSFASPACNSAVCPPNSSNQDRQEQFMQNEYGPMASPMEQQQTNELETAQPPKPLQIDPSDPSSLLSANTLSNHEETLRYHQKKIHEMQKELSKSQQHLRHQQQMIWMAKKAQVRCDATGRQLTQAEFWINQLDTKDLRNSLVQNILQHKTQQKQLQTQIADHKQLVSTEQKLQEELHIDQAVTDIVRLIKQDSRTALLIVQLLRRYQLERTHELVDDTNNQPAINTTKSGIHDQQAMDCCHPVNNENSQCNDDLMILEDGMQVSQKDAAYSNNTNLSAMAAARSKKKALNGSRSIWHPRSQSTSGQRVSPASKSSDDISLRKKTSINKRGSNSAMLDASNASSVDMDEIFRTVLKNASSKPLDSSNSAAKPLEMVLPKPVQRKILKAEKEICGEGDETSKAKKIRRKRQPNVDSKEAESTALQIMPQFDNFHLTTTPTTYNSETMTQLACCSDLIPNVEASDSTNQSVVTSTSLDINCFNKSSANEHASLQSISKSGATFDYIKNHAFDDLMDVLRDDQEKSLLGSFENVTNFADYGNMNQQHLQYNAMTTQNSHNFPSNQYQPTQHLSQFQQHSSNSSSHGHHHHPDSMDIIPPHSIQNSSVDGQHSRDEGFSSSSVCSTNSYVNDQQHSTVGREQTANVFNQQNSNAGLFDANDQDMEWFENIDSILESDTLGHSFANINGFQPSVRPMDAFV
uniref:Metalloprotease TIKI homolog n=1 Tax=Ditylenchus dipsaci TaxID=166011 RepID=A0A915D1N2_9BILA